LADIFTTLPHPGQTGADGETVVVTGLPQPLQNLVVGFITVPQVLQTGVDAKSCPGSLVFTINGFCLLIIRYVGRAIISITKVNSPHAQGFIPRFAASLPTNTAVIPPIAITTIRVTQIEVLDSIKIFLLISQLERVWDL
jgi:hypothetical protein